MTTFDYIVTLKATMKELLDKCKDMLERAREEIQNCYGRDIELTDNISDLLEELENVSKV